MTQYRKYGSRYPEIEKYKSISENAYSNTKLNSVGIKHVNKLVVTHLNINSPMIEFEFLTEFVEGKVNDFRNKNWQDLHTESIRNC